MKLSAQQNARVREMFAEAVETPAVDRPTWIDRECRGIPAAVRDALESLLAAHEQAGSFLCDPTISPNDTDPIAARSLVGSMAAPASVGPYRIERELGRGGFGTVYLAIQEQPIRRPVALKIINPGMDSRQVIARFEAERQALALMSHPGIARVFEAGASETGRPYFVMEWVDGRPITEFCASPQMPLRDRLTLMVDVCRGVQHAHQKGVIHRDLKPSNVLVAEVDGKPAPKVIDFGVAKALTGRLSDNNFETEQRQLIGTPQYMSPEQAAGGAAAIDTRTDVYGLGAMLYELLCGAPPFDPARLRMASLAELQRIVREEEPPVPSRRMVGRSSGVACEFPVPARSLRGDLDRIVMRAIDKDPARRYPTADALAADILRHLAGEPVEAAPATLRYRAGKFLRRHRGSLAATAVVLVGTIVGAVGWMQARESAAEAVANGKVAAERQQRMQEAEAATGRERALVKAAQQAIVELLVPRQSQTLEEQQHAVQRLTKLDEQLQSGELKAPPQLAAPLHSGMAYAYEHYGLLAKAEEHYRSAIQLQRQAEPPLWYPLAQDLSNLGNVLITRKQWKEADAAAAEAVTLFRNPALGAKDEFRLSQALVTQGVARVMLSDTSGGVTKFQEGMAVAREGPGMPASDEEWSYRAFADALTSAGQVDLAADYYALARRAAARMPSTKPAQDRPLLTEPDALNTMLVPFQSGRTLTRR